MCKAETFNHTDTSLCSQNNHHNIIGKQTLLIQYISSFIGCFLSFRAKSDPNLNLY